MRKSLALIPLIILLGVSIVRTSLAQLYTVDKLQVFSSVESEIEFQSFDERRIEGRYKFEGFRGGDSASVWIPWVDFRSEKLEEYFLIQVGIGERYLKIKIFENEQRLIVSLAGDGSAEDPKTAEKIVKDLENNELLNSSSFLENSQFQILKKLLIRTFAFLGEADSRVFKSGFYFDSKDLEAEDEGLLGGRCIKNGELVSAKFTRFSGQKVHVKDVRIDVENSTNGACGTWYLKTGWTQDCFSHDVCWDHMEANEIFEIVGGLGPNCFDEFVFAIDDFFLSDLFWGCEPYDVPKNL